MLLNSKRGEKWSKNSLTWNLKVMVSKRNLLFQGAIYRFHVKLWEGEFAHFPLSDCHGPLPTLTSEATTPWHMSGSKCRDSGQCPKDGHRCLDSLRPNRFFKQFFVWKGTDQVKKLRDAHDIIFWGDRRESTLRPLSFVGMLKVGADALQGD